jgi:hypothetical protein
LHNVIPFFYKKIRHGWVQRTAFIATRSIARVSPP